MESASIRHGVRITAERLRPEISLKNDGRVEPQLWIDGPGKEIMLHHNASVDGTYMRQWTGQARTIDIVNERNETPTPVELDRLLNGPVGQELIARIFAGTSEEWDGSNHVGIWDDDAVEALEDLESKIHAIGCISWDIWDARDWLETVDAAEENGIDAATSDDRLAEIAAEVETDALENDGGRQVILTGAIEYLTELRDEAREAIADDLYNEEPGHVSAIEVAPAGELETQPAAVDLVLLTPGVPADTTTVAYRYSTMNHDEDWRIGTLEQAADYAAEIRDALDEPDPAGCWITMAEAAQLAGVTIQAISQRATAGKLATRTDPDANQRQGRRLVRRSDVI